MTTTCERCGVVLGVGRYCTNCGHRIDAATAATLPPAEPLRPSAAPPPAHQVPPPARFPLFADETPSGVADEPAAATRVDLPVVAHEPITVEPVAAEPVAAEPVAPAGRHGRRRPAVLLGAAAAVAVLAVGAAVVATRDGDPAGGGAGSGSGDTSEAAGPLERGVDLAPGSRIRAPKPGPPSTDVATGAPVTYGAENLVDGDPATAWRTPGDATGARFVVRLPQEAEVHSVAIVNGYAKTSQVGGRTYDWYEGGRRVLRVRWTFDDGTSVTQRLIDTRDPQRLDVGSVRTRTVRLRVLAVSGPGTGPATRDATAISTLQVLGSPA